MAASRMVGWGYVTKVSDAESCEESDPGGPDVGVPDANVKQAGSNNTGAGEGQVEGQQLPGNEVKKVSKSTRCRRKKREALKDVGVPDTNVEQAGSNNAGAGAGQDEGRVEGQQLLDNEVKKVSRSTRRRRHRQALKAQNALAVAILPSEAIVEEEMEVIVAKPSRRPIPAPRLVSPPPRFRAPHSIRRNGRHRRGQFRISEAEYDMMAFHFAHRIFVEMMTEAFFEMILDSD